MIPHLYIRSSDGKHTNTTVGIAVGLGVGIPVLLTVLILIWVTVRHNRRIREEDEMDKEIDFNGDVSFWSPRHAQIARFDRDQDLIDDSLSKRTLSDPNSSTVEKSSQPTADSSILPQAGGDESSLVGTSGIISDLDPHVSQLYTPEFMFQHGSQENFSKALNSVYGPSPVYPSSEKLRAPSSASLRSQPTGATGMSGFVDYNGPFATPPRRGSQDLSSPSSRFAFRRGSNGSQATSLASFSHPPTQPSFNFHDINTPGPISTPLGQVRETPHPYMDLAGTQSVGGANVRVEKHQNGSNIALRDDESTLSDNEELEARRHVYHEAAKPARSGSP